MTQQVKTTKKQVKTTKNYNQITTQWKGRIK